MTDYTKRAFEDGAATAEKLFRARSLEQAIGIHSDFTTRTFEGYTHELSRIGNLYAELFKNSFEPIAHALQNSAQQK